MLTYCNNLSVKDYCDLRTSVGWPFISDDQAQSGLDNSDFIISCVDEGRTVAFRQRLVSPYDNPDSIYFDIYAF